MGFFTYSEDLHVVVENVSAKGYCYSRCILLCKQAKAGVFCAAKVKARWAMAFVRHEGLRFLIYSSEDAGLHGFFSLQFLQSGPLPSNRIEALSMQIVWIASASCLISH